MLVISGLFSIAETSMMAVNRYRLKALVRMGNRGAQYAAELLGKADRLLGVILVFSEVTPKVIGAAYAERIAQLASYVLKPLLRILYPVVWFVNLFVAPLLYVFRVHSKSGAHSQRMTMEELRLLVLESGQFMP